MPSPTAITNSYSMGKDAKVLIDDATTNVPGVTNVSVTMSRESVDVTTRDDGGYTKKIPGLKTITAEIEFYKIEGNATQQVFYSAWHADASTVDLTVKSKTNGGGFSGDFCVNNITEEQSKEGPVTVKVSVENFGECAEILATS